MPAAEHWSISANANVDLLLERLPGAVPVFVKRRMHCVGCPIARFETLAEVCAIYRQPLDSLLAELRAVEIAGGPRPDHGTLS